MKIPSLHLSSKTKSRIRKYAVRIFAGIGVLVTLSMVLGFFGFRYWLTKPKMAMKTPESMVLTLDFTMPIVERPRDFSLSLPALLDEEEETTLFSIVRALDAAKDDPKVKGVVARFSNYASPKFFQTQEITAALQRFRASNKPTYSFASSYGNFARGGALYALASQFEHRWLQPVGVVGLTGLGIEAPFGKTALEKIGVKADFLRREEYKSVMENVSRDSFSPAVRSNMESLIGSLHSQIAQGIAQGLKLDEKQAKALIANGPYTANEALKTGLVTKIGYEDELEKVIDEKAGKDSAYVDPDTYLYLAHRDKEEKTKADVALIFAEGIINDAPSRGPYSLTKDDVIDTESIVEAFAQAAEDKDIKAILFRVDSPGGSPVASETIRRALIKAKEAKKPVFVSMGNVAASGGYWISMDADYIVANPSTVTGSIGVVGGKFVLGGLYDKFDIKWDGIATSDNAKFFSTREAFGPKGEERLNAMLDETYNAFLANVSSARKIPLEKMKDVAKGRVYTGELALKAGLVDELGGLDTAIQALKKKLDLQPTDKIALYPLPPPETPQTMVMRLLRNMGLQGAFALFPELQNIQSHLSPLLDELEQTSAVRATMPAVFSQEGW